MEEEKNEVMVGKISRNFVAWQGWCEGPNWPLGTGLETKTNQLILSTWTTINMLRQ